jgi:hypothetical protein
MKTIGIMPSSSRTTKYKTKFLTSHKTIHKKIEKNKKIKSKNCRSANTPLTRRSCPVKKVAKNSQRSPNRVFKIIVFQENCFSRSFKRLIRIKKKEPAKKRQKAKNKTESIKNIKDGSKKTKNGIKKFAFGGIDVFKEVR